jgi:hypothetical protein
MGEGLRPGQRSERLGGKRRQEGVPLVALEPEQLLIRHGGPPP